MAKAGGVKSLLKIIADLTCWQHVCVALPVPLGSSALAPQWWVVPGLETRLFLMSSFHLEESSALPSMPQSIPQV